MRQYYRKNRSRFIAKAINRDRAKRALTRNPELIIAWMMAVRTKPEAVCYYCRVMWPISEIHFDHVLPLKRGGNHTIENLCVACKTCNLRKNAKLIHEWNRPGQQLLDL